MSILIFDIKRKVAILQKEEDMRESIKLLVTHPKWEDYQVIVGNIVDEEMSSQDVSQFPSFITPQGEA
jgi:hypothetical protein